MLTMSKHREESVRDRPTEKSARHPGKYVCLPAGVHEARR